MDSICELSNESPTKEVFPKEFCRLRHGLNNNCLLEVFDYLDVDDLLEVCKLDIYFEELITKWTIGKRLFSLRCGDVDISEDISKSLKFFQKFGKSLRKFIIHSKVDDLLNTIIKNCEPHKFTELCLVQQRFGTFNLEVVHESMPYFSNLRKFTFHNGYPRLWHEDGENTIKFLTKFSTVVLNLQILELNYVDIQGEWLQNLKNLRELVINWPPNLSFDDLSSCLMVNSKLEKFRFTGVQDITAVGDVLSKHCPNLKHFRDIHRHNPYSQFDDALKNRYNFLSSFSKLNEVTLTSYTFCGSDLYYPLKNLETKKILTLKVHVLCNEKVRPTTLNIEQQADILRRKLPNFACMQTLGIAIGTGKWYEISDEDAQWTQIDLRCQFLFRLVPHLRNVQNVVLYSERLSNLYKILELLPNLRTLSIAHAYMRNLMNEVQKVIGTLRTNRQLNGVQNLLHLKLSNEQRKKLLTIQDLDEFFTTAI